MPPRLLILAAFLLTASLLTSCEKKVSPVPLIQKQVDINTLQSVASTYFENTKASTFVLHFIDQADFYCGLCQQSFLFMSDSLQRSRNVFQLVLLRVNDQQDNHETLAQTWKKQLNISGAVHSDSMRLFEQGNIPKSSVFLFNEQMKLVEWGTYPLEPEVKNAIFNAIRQMTLVEVMDD